MRILIVNNCIIPVHQYGGTERVIWGLGKELTQLGHKVTYLVNQGSTCDFATVLFIDPAKPIVDQIADNYDVVHFQFQPHGVEALKLPYVVTMHGNTNDLNTLNSNTVFVSKNHAERYGSSSYVHNGLDWRAYDRPDIQMERKYFHFLGKAAWRVKNVAGAIDVIKKTKDEKLMVLGGVRFNFKMGVRFTFSPRIRFAGMVGGSEKHRLLNQSKGLVFPVRWHEPFNLAIIESLFYGCPVFGTPYGSLPELVGNDVGFLADNVASLTDAVNHADRFSRVRCHEYARDLFNSRRMAIEYIKCYDRVMSGQHLNPSPPQLKNIQVSKFLDWS